MAGAPRAAAQADLRWISDEQPGIARRPKAAGFTYVGVGGRAVTDEPTLNRIRRLAIPPAWRDVWISPHADGHLQATGRDARGRKQYRYHPAWVASRGHTKFDGLRHFGQVLPRLRARVKRELAADTATPTRDRVLATLVHLLDTTWLRIGNDAYARANGSFGLSTLHNRHVAVQGATLRLSFVGKSGVRHEVRLNDRRLARVIRRCRELPGQDLFQYVDENGTVHRMGSTDVNGWLTDTAGLHITAKDFRTWHGSVQALALTLDACAAGASPCTPQEVLAAVARRLGNTPAVCRKAYVHPRVLALGSALANAADREALHRAAWVKQGPKVRGLETAERQLLALLGRRDRGRQ